MQYFETIGSIVNNMNVSSFCRKGLHLIRQKFGTTTFKERRTYMQSIRQKCEGMNFTVIRNYAFLVGIRGRGQVVHEFHSETS